jgi:hypothetical protein
MLEMARVFKDNDHVALVTSDHDYLMTPDKYEQQLIEAQVVSKALSFPVICGLEISLYYEEAVLIGTEACKAWLEYRKKHRADALEKFYKFHPPISDVKVVLEGHSYGLCLVHPGLRGTEDLYKLFHCYEHTNGRSKWDKEDLDQLKILAPQARGIIGLDAHSTLYISDPLYVCNEAEAGNWDEQKIIEWMRKI